MRVISKKSLENFYENPRYSDSKNVLKAWHKEVLELNWNNLNEIRLMYRNTSIIGDEGVVFNIAGDKYRIIVKINYYAKIVFIKFVGTHKQYDKINAEDL